jgi:hypothetical protein
VAVIDLVPALANVVLSVALPALSVPVPNVVVPSLNVTVPVGLKPVTVAVSVTDCVTIAGLGVTAKLVVLVAVALTIRPVATDVLVVLLTSPP